MQRWVSFITLCFLTTCLLFAAKVSVDYRHSADFNQYHTYSWARVKAGDQIWQDRITQSVDQQLTAKGWQKVENGGEVAVTAFGSAANQQSLNTFYDGFGGGWFWGGFGDGMATTTVVNTPVGTLVVDMFDTRTKKLIWRAVATDVLSDKPEKNEKKLVEAVDDMFKKFPPESKG